MSFFLRHCGVLIVRLTPQDSLALILNFLLFLIYYEFTIYGL
jgi:hypothetical protein